MCGYPPFNGADNNKTHQSILKGWYYFPEEDWKGVSMEAMDFIRGMLQMNPQKRMTVEEALNHRWIVQHANTTDLMMMKDDLLENSSVQVVYSEKLKTRHVVQCNSSPTRRPTQQVRMP